MAEKTDIFTGEEDSRNVLPNKDFAMVWGPAWDRLINIPVKNAQATRLYAFLAKHSSPRGGAVAASYSTLAEALEVSEMTIRRAAKYLTENEIIVRFRAGVGAYVYALNPEEVWKSQAEFKRYAAFHTMTLVSTKDAKVLELYVKKMTSKTAGAEKPKAGKRKKAAKAAAPEQPDIPDRTADIGRAA